MGGNGDNSTVFDIDLGVGAFGNALDGATTRTDHCSNQFRIDAEAQQAWCMGRQRFTGLVNRLEHLLEDVQPSGTGLVHSIGNDLHG